MEAAGDLARDDQDAAIFHGGKLVATVYAAGDEIEYWTRDDAEGGDS